MQEGINLQPQASSGSSAVIQLVSAGTAPIGEANMGLIAQAISQGAPLKMVGLLWAKDSLGIISLTSEHISKPSDLIGKKIGEVTGSSNALTLAPWLQLNHVNASAVQVVNFGSSPLLITALTSGQVDAVDMGVVWVPTFQVSNYTVSIMTRDAWGLNIYGNGIVVNTNFLAHNQDLVHRFLLAYYTSINWAFQNPTPAVQDMIKANPAMSPTILTASMPAIYDMYVDSVALSNGLGYFDSAKATQTIQVAETDLYTFAHPINATDVYTNSYLPVVLPSSTPPPG